MKLNLSQFLPDKDLAENGIWKELYPAISFKIASASSSNSKFKELQLSIALDSRPKNIEKIKTEEKMTEAFLKDTEALKKYQEKEKELYSLSIIKDWKGIFKEDKTDLPYTSENALMLLDQFPDVFDKIKKIATDDSLFLLSNSDEKEELKKKSSDTSNQGSNTKTQKA